MPDGAHIVGIDISAQQLEANTVLDEKILGDIQDYPLSECAFDMVICWDVLEHLDRPADALRNFSQALAPGGMMVLAFPNPCSVKGFLTKVTPHWFHVFIYKYVFRHPWAGKPGRGPFRTVMSPIVRPESLERLAAEMGLDVAFLRLFEGGSQEILRSRLRVVGPVWEAAKFLAKVLILGRLDAALTDCIIVLEKPTQQR